MATKRSREYWEESVKSTLDLLQITEKDPYYQELLERTVEMHMAETPEAKAEAKKRVMAIQDKRHGR